MVTALPPMVTTYFLLLERSLNMRGESKTWREGGVGVDEQKNRDI